MNYNDFLHTKVEVAPVSGFEVCPPLAEAMVRANLPEWCTETIATMDQFHKAVAI